MALSLMMANIGGAVGSNIFLASEIPRYWTGYGLSACFLVLAIVCAIVLRSVLVGENRRRDKFTEADIRAKYSEGMLESPPMLQDLQSWALTDSQRSCSIWGTSHLYIDTCTNSSTYTSHWSLLAASDTYIQKAYRYNGPLPTPEHIHTHDELTC